jgi:DNA-binding GntR family transcriptional regulator
VERVFSVATPLVPPASALAADAIREAILDGRFTPGLRLKEERLAAQLGISRTPIREALLLLQAEGLIEAVPNRGAFVRSFDVVELLDMYELRALLEGHAARRAAVRMTPDQFSDLRSSRDRFKALVDTSGSVSLDLVKKLVRENGIFHDSILEAAADRRLSAMVRQVVALPLVYRSYVWYSSHQARVSAHAHAKLVCALEQRDASRAERLMREHVYEARDVLTQHIADLSVGRRAHPAMLDASLAPLEKDGS